MVNAEKTRSLLSQTKTIIKHQRELEKLRGESFNVFSILKMENKENATHSAFLAELLNPEGSHYKETAFLELFLDALGEPHINHLDLASTQVKVEHHVGYKNYDDLTGGRIDIFLEDKTGNCISIENKIHAGDQDGQVERYCNYRKGKNKVFYLTLEGNEPSEASKGLLKSNTDFFNISYRDDIQLWLDKCLKESAEQPILRESIKQYKLLIRNLTSTMDATNQKELTSLMFMNLDEAKYIAHNFFTELNKLKDQIRQNVFQKLQSQLQEIFLIQLGDPIHKDFAQIWIKLKGFENSPYYFGLESFHSILFLGVFNQEGRNDFGEVRNEQKKWWTLKEQIQNFKGIAADLSDAKAINQLHSDDNFREEFENYVVDSVVNYLNQFAKPLQEYLSKNG
jgi:hypothetical protein